MTKEQEARRQLVLSIISKSDTSVLSDLAVVAGVVDYRSALVNMRAAEARKLKRLIQRYENIIYEIDAAVDGQIQRKIYDELNKLLRSIIDRKTQRS